MLVGTFVTIIVLIQRPPGKPVDHTKLDILKFLSKEEHHLESLSSVSRGGSYRRILTGF